MTDSGGKSSGAGDPRSSLASVSELLEREDVGELIEAYSRTLVLEAIRAALANARERLGHGQNAHGAKHGQDAHATEHGQDAYATEHGQDAHATGHGQDAHATAHATSSDEIVECVRERLALVELDRLRPVVNATGVILHTGLGRAVLPQSAVDALSGLSRCCNLQVDLNSGERGRRNYMSEALLCRLTGAEAAMLVTNNAAATLLILTVFAQGKEVIISRGQLIEIGGSFRLPDCISQSGATMVEVGTTNKTHLRDYEAALSEETGIVFRCNPSNYRVVGFTKSVPTADLATLKEKQDLLVVDDLGCGALVDLSLYGLPKEPMAQESVAAGADLVCFSGDKLIGGPQAGIIVGKKDLIAKIKKHPLTRMLRVGKLTDMALEHTLRLFLKPETLTQTNPTIAMLAAPAAELKKRAQRLKKQIDKIGGGLDTEVLEAVSATGGGSLPATQIGTWALALSSPTLSADRLSRRLRLGEPPILARIAEGRVLLDMRTLMIGDEKIILEALAKICQ